MSSFSTCDDGIVRIVVKMFVGHLSFVIRSKSNFVFNCIKEFFSILAKLWWELNSRLLKSVKLVYIDHPWTPKLWPLLTSVRSSERPRCLVQYSSIFLPLWHPHCPKIFPCSLKHIFFFNFEAPYLRNSYGFLGTPVNKYWFGSWKQSLEMIMGSKWFK